MKVIGIWKMSVFGGLAWAKKRGALPVLLYLGVVCSDLRQLVRVHGGNGRGATAPVVGVCIILEWVAVCAHVDPSTIARCNI